MIENLEVKEHFSTSDHNIVCWNLVSKIEMPLSNGTKSNYSKADYAKIIERLKEIDRKLKFQDLDAEKMWNIFCDTLNEVILTFVPKKINKSRKFPVWMTKDAKKQRKNKVRMWKRYKEDMSYNNLVEYKLALNRATSTYKTAKADFESRLAKNIKTNPKAFYNYIRSKSKTKEKVGPLKDENGSVISDSNGMCKVLNNFAIILNNIKNDSKSFYAYVGSK